MGVLVNLWTQVRRTLNWQNGGTGNTQGWSTGVIKVCWNRTESSIALNTLVKLTATYNDARVTPCDATTDKVLGVVVGYWDPDDPQTLIRAAAPDVSMVAVLTHGTTRVIVNASGATRGQFAFPSTTAGAASSSATIGSGAFGVYQGSGGASGTAIVTLTGSQGVGIGASASFGTPALTLGTADAEGAASTAIRTDASVALFDATVPTTQGFGDAAATGAAALAARRDHVHGMPSATDIVDSAPSDRGWFGDGSDGAASFDGATDFASFSSRAGSVYTLSQDTHLSSCTVDAGVTVDTNGYHLNVRGTLNNDGTICRVAANGANGGSGGAALTSKSTGGSSGKGADRVTSAGTAAGSTGATNTTLGFGGPGGAGGASSGGGAGGAGGAAPVIAPQRGDPRHLPWGAMGWVLGSTGSGLFLGGAGGGSGGSTGILGSGGGGGAGGGVVIVKAHKIANGAGVIHANGGNGGNGAVNVGWGGGGGGGGGGVVVLVYNILTGPGTIRAAGGAKGTAPGGAPATDGNDGSAGKVVHLAMS